MRIFCFLFAAIILFFPYLASAKIEEITTKNGVKIWVSRDETVAVFSLKIAFTKTGYAYDDEDKSGLANISAIMLTEGADDLDALAFKKALDDKAIKISANVDADNFYINLTSLSKHQQASLQLLQKLITKPRFDEDALARIKLESIAGLLRLEDRPGYIAGREWARRYFGEHDYSKSQHGTKTGIETIKGDDLHKYIKRSFTQKNMVVAVAGDFNAENLSNDFENMANNLPQQFEPAARLEEVKNVINETQKETIEKDLPQVFVQFGGTGLKREDPRYMAGFLLNDIVGGSTLKSKLGEELREKSGLTYGINTDIFPMHSAGLFIGSFSTRFEKKEEALGKLKMVIESIANNGVSEQELKDSKLYLTGSFPLLLDTNAELVAFMMNMQINNLGIDYLERRNSLINSVTLSEVNILAKEMLNFEKWLVVLVGKNEI